MARGRIQTHFWGKDASNCGEQNKTEKNRKEKKRCFFIRGKTGFCVAHNQQRRADRVTEKERELGSDSKQRRKIKERKMKRKTEGRWGRKEGGRWRLEG